MNNKNNELVDNINDNLRSHVKTYATSYGILTQQCNSAGKTAI